jgi:hypothetical protein
MIPLTHRAVITGLVPVISLGRGAARLIGMAGSSPAMKEKAVGGTGERPLADSLSGPPRVAAVQGLSPLKKSLVDAGDGAI